MKPLFRNAEELLAFVSAVDGATIKCECVDRAWIAEVWEELEKTEFDIPRGGRNGRAIVLDFTRGMPFDEAFRRSDRAQRAALGAVSRWFIMRCVGGEDGLASLPRLSVYETEWRGGEAEAAGLRGKWMAVELAPSENEDDGLETKMFTRGAHAGEAAPARLTSARVLDEPEQGVLQALHFPAPEGEDGAGAEGGGGGGLLNRLRERGGEAVRRVGAWIEDALVPALVRPPLVVPAGGGFAPIAVPHIHSYIGSPEANAGDGFGIPNPMNGGGQQAFVGILDVGQGNCNAIVDSHGHIVAYYDFGITKSGDLPDALFSPCFCNRPFIIISHWDHDHYMLFTRAPESFRCTWITPRQGNGTVTSTLGGSVKKAGGRIYVWAAGHPSYMAFPWGYVERCTGNARTDYNSSGLAAWVCVQELNANSTTPGTPPWATPGPPHSLTDEGTSDVLTRARAAVGDGQVTGLGGGITQNLATCLAAVLGNSRYGVTLTAANCALAAADTATAIVAAVGVNALIPLPGNITAAANANNDLNGIPVGLLRTRAAALTAVAATAAFVAYRNNHSVGNAAWCPFGSDGGTSMNAVTVDTEANNAGIGITGELTTISAAVACALKSSRFGQYLTDAEAAGAAVRAVNAVIAEVAHAGGLANMVPTPDDVPAAAQTNGALNNLPDTIMQRQRAQRELSIAMVAAYHALTLGLPLEIAAECAGAGFIAPQGQPWPQAAAGALDVPLADVPQVRTGAAPFAAGERYLLLTGDANFDSIPTCNQTPMPVVVGLVAMHHGSFLEGGVYLDGSRIPWAPSSNAAVRAEYVRAQIAIGQQRMIELACDAAHNGPTLATTTAANHVAASAAAALLYAYSQSLHPAGDMLFDEQTANLVAASAAAIAFTAYLIRANVFADDARIVGIAAALPMCITKTNPLPTPPGQLAMAAQTIRGHGIGVTANQVIAATRGVVGIAGNTNYGNNMATGAQLAHGLNGAGNYALDAANASTAARTVTTAGLQGLGAQAAFTNIAGWLASAAINAVDGGALVGDEATSAGVPGSAAAVTAAVVQKNDTVFAGQPDLVTTTACAARWAGEAVAAHLAGVSIDQIWAVMQAVNDGSLNDAAAVHNAPASARIAYTYGVRANGKHAYRSKNLGQFGHPHPPALAAYEARGWTERRNACHRANAGLVLAGHLDQDDAVNPAGHVALCWDDGNDAVVGAGAHNYTCATCGNALAFNI